MQITGSVENQALVYSSTYMAAFLISGIILYISGRRKAYPVTSWLLVIAIIIFFTILGNKLFTALPGEWEELFTSLNLPQSGRKSVLGGIAGLIIGLLITKYFLRIRVPIAYHFAYLVPVTIGIARIGCLLNGCCHGLPTQLPWGIRYGQGTHAFMLHQSKGLINTGSDLSLSVHPTQVYDILICIAVVFLVWVTRNYWKRKSNRLMFAVLAYGSLRFFEEFFRESSHLPVVGDYFWGMKIVQWIILTGVLFVALYLVLSEYYGSSHHTCDKPFKIHPLRGSLVLGITWLIILFNIYWYTYFELLTLLFFLVPATVNYLLRLYRFLTIKELQKVLPVFILVMIVIMGQSYIPQKEGGKITFVELAVDGLASYYTKEVSQYTRNRTDCDGDSHPVMENHELREYTTYLGSFEISKTIIKSKYTWQRFGGGVFAGKDDVYISMDGSSYSETTVGGHFRGEFNWKFFGFGIGLRIGQQRIAIGDRSGETMTKGDYQNEMGEYKVLPIQFLRFGKQDVIYGEVNMSYDLPAGKPIPFISGGIGSGLGKMDGTNIGVGYSDAGYYMKGLYIFRKKHGIKAYCANNFRRGTELIWVVSLGYRFRFNFESHP